MDELRIWKLLIAIYMVVAFIPVYRFRGHKFFFYFIILSLIDPIYFIFRFSFHIHNYNYLPLSTVVMLFGLPTKDQKVKFISFVILIILISNLGENHLLELMICEAIFSYIIYCMIESLVNELQTRNEMSFFLMVLIIFTFVDAFNLYLYYENVFIFSKYFALTLVVEMILLSIISLSGPDTKLAFGKRKVKQVPVNNIDTSTKDIGGLNWEKNLHKTKLALTEAEKRVLLELSNGLKSQEIADKLFISRKTVYFHCNNMKSKLNMKTISQLIKFAVENRENLLNETKPRQTTSTRTLKTVILPVKNR